MNTATETERVSLQYKEGGSDKVYQASIEPRGSGFVVNFAFGRRGSTLNTGSKTSAPVDLDTARRIFQKLVSEKKRKGYTEHPSGAPYHHTDEGKEHTGILPQLLNPVPEGELALYLRDDNWCMQEKFDGRRVLIRKRSRQILGINRRGLVIGLPLPVLERVRQLPDDFLIDGECVGEQFHAFDILDCGGEDLREAPYWRRLFELAELLGPVENPHVRYVQTVFEAAEKEAFLARAKAERKEGIVLKFGDAAYTPGRPNSGGPQLKLKFYATLSAVVAAHNSGRSVELRLLGKEGWNPCGNVTVPPNHPMPQPGQVVEVRYLYAFRQSGALYQPVYLGPRSDLDHAECAVTQLKFKAGEEEEDQTPS